MEPVDCKSTQAGLPGPMARRMVKGKGSIQRALLGCLVLLATASTLYLSSGLFSSQDRGVIVPLDAESILAKCRSLSIKPGPPADFHSRAQSDRFEPGTKAVLIRNATIWTGEDYGKEVLHGDLFLDDGLIKAIGVVPAELLARAGDVVVIDAQG